MEMQKRFSLARLDSRFFVFASLFCFFENLPDVIKVMKVTGEGGTFPKVRKNQRMYQAFSLVHKKLKLY